MSLYQIDKRYQRKGTQPPQIEAYDARTPAGRDRARELNSVRRMSKASDDAVMSATKSVIQNKLQPGAFKYDPRAIGLLGSEGSFQMQRQRTRLMDSVREVLPIERSTAAASSSSSSSSSFAPTRNTTTPDWHAVELAALDCEDEDLDEHYRLEREAERAEAGIDDEDEDETESMKDYGDHISEEERELGTEDYYHDEPLRSVAEELLDEPTYKPTKFIAPDPVTDEGMAAMVEEQTSEAKRVHDQVLKNAEANNPYWRIFSQDDVLEHRALMFFYGLMLASAPVYNEDDRNEVVEEGMTVSQVIQCCRNIFYECQSEIAQTVQEDWNRVVAAYGEKSPYDGGSLAVAEYLLAAFAARHKAEAWEIPNCIDPVLDYSEFIRLNDKSDESARLARQRKLDLYPDYDPAQPHIMPPRSAEWYTAYRHRALAEKAQEFIRLCLNIDENKLSAEHRETTLFGFYMMDRETLRGLFIKAGDSALVLLNQFCRLMGWKEYTGQHLADLPLSVHPMDADICVHLRQLKTDTGHGTDLVQRAKCLEEPGIAVHNLCYSGEAVPALKPDQAVFNGLSSPVLSLEDIAANKHLAYVTLVEKRIIPGLSRHVFPHRYLPAEPLSFQNTMEDQQDIRASVGLARLTTEPPQQRQRDHVAYRDVIATDIDAYNAKYLTDCFSKCGDNDEARLLVLTLAILYTRTRSTAARHGHDHDIFAEKTRYLFLAKEQERLSEQPRWPHLPSVAESCFDERDEDERFDEILNTHIADAGINLPPVVPGHQTQDQVWVCRKSLKQQLYRALHEQAHLLICFENLKRTANRRTFDVYVESLGCTKSLMAMFYAGWGGRLRNLDEFHLVHQQPLQYPTRRKRPNLELNEEDDEEEGGEEGEGDDVGEGNDEETKSSKKKNKFT